MAESVQTPPVQPETPTAAPYASFTSDGVTVESNTETSAQLETALTPPAKAEAKSTEPPAEVPDGAEVPEVPEVEPLAARNDDGTFKAKDKGKGKPRHDPDARISQAVAKQRDAERRADAAEAKLAAAAAPKVDDSPAKAAPEKQPSAAEWQRYKALPDAPKVEQFDDYTDFTIALAAFVADKRHDDRESARQATQAQTAQSAAFEKHAAAFTPRWQAALEAEPDFPDRVLPSLLSAKALSAMTPADGRPTLANFLADRILKSAHPKDVALYLSDPQHSQRIATLPPDDIVAELAIFEHRLGAASASGSAPKVPAKSQIEPPIQPVRGSSHVADGPPGDDATDAEYEAYWGPRRAKLRQT